MYCLVIPGIEWRLSPASEGGNSVLVGPWSAERIRFPLQRSPSLAWGRRRCARPLCPAAISKSRAWSRFVRLALGILRKYLLGFLRFSAFSLFSISFTCDFTKILLSN